MKQIRRASNRLLEPIPNDLLSTVRTYYIYNEDHINKAECVAQGRASINKGDYKIVEVHMHGAGTDVVCPGVYLKDEDGRCFRFGKGID